jgi:hypothetical protein
MNRAALLPGGLLLAALIFFGGCHSMGPGTIARDRFDYSSAMTDSWKRQMLLNIVKLRYSDPPIFVDIGQIVAGYQVEGFVGSTGQTYSGGTSSNFLNAVGQFRYIDRPTITYTPLTGSRYITSLISPISPGALFNSIQAGWPADLILQLGTVSINGNRAPDRESATGGEANSANYRRILELMRRLQVNNALSIRLETDAAKKSTTLITLRAPDLAPTVASEADELRRLLGLDPAANEFALVYGSFATNSREIAIQSRSLMRIMGLFGDQIDVPPQDITDGRAMPNRSGPATSGTGVRIQCGPTAPSDAFVSITYRGQSFWVDDRDLNTKRAFSLIMLLFTLADSGTPTSQPVLTIPTG